MQSLRINSINNLQTEFLWLLSLLGNILTPLDFSSIAFFTEERSKQKEDISKLNLIERTYSSQITHYNNTKLHRNLTSRLK